MTKLNNMRLIMTLVLSGLMTASMMAVPAFRGWRTVEQPDGTEITIRQVGDEFFHYWETEDGVQYKHDAINGWQKVENATMSEVQKAKQASRKYNQQDMSKPRRAAGTLNLAPRGLVILVNYSDVSFYSKNTRQDMDDLMNAASYTYDGATGSAREYFRAQSNGQYVPDFDVVGPYTLSNNRAHYGANDSNDDDVLPGDMIVEACKAADADGVDFTKYNNDGDTYVDFVYVIYAGAGEADSDVDDAIWPHNWDLESARSYNNCSYSKSQCKFDGLYVNNYACSGELNYGEAGSRCGIGTVAHEFGHVLGLPDYYVTSKSAANYKYNYTPGAWTIMDYGSYNNDGKTPPNYSAFDKYYFGWDTPELLAKDAAQNITLTTAYSDSYQITGGTSLLAARTTQRVWYIENRQKTGWDKYLPGHGMIVWEVTYSSSNWSNNAPNNNTVGYTIVTANNTTRPYSPYEYKTTASSTSATPFPGTSKVKSYTPATGCAMTEITESGSAISFKYNGGISGHSILTNGTGCTIDPSTSTVQNGQGFTATITPTDATYDFSSISVTRGSTTLTQGSHYSLSSDKKTLTVNASAVTGSESDAFTITVVWTKNRYKYELLGENCTPEEAEDMVTKNAALNLTIQPASGYTLSNAACWDVSMGGNTLTYGTGFTYDGTTFKIASVTDDVEIIVYGGKQVTWMANGTTFATTLTSSDKYVLPTTTPDIECDGKVFVGWCATEKYSSETEAPILIQEGDAANKGTVLYAVFATKGEGDGSMNVEDQLTRATTGVTKNSSSYEDWSGKSVNSDAVYAGYSAGDKDAIQLRSKNSESGIITTTSGGKIKKVTVTWNSYTTSGRKIDVYGKNTAYSEASDLYGSEAGTLLGSIPDTKTELVIEGSYTFVGVRSNSGALYLDNITFTWETSGGASYSDFATMCTPPCEGELTGITLNTDNVKKVFTEGDAFNYDGLVVTANYDGCDSKTVKPTNVSTPNMNQSGKQEVTVTYEGKTAKYEITINALPTYAIRFFNNGAQVGETQNVKQGQAATKPAQDPGACEEYTFAGWYTAALPESNTQKPTYITDFTATKDQDYYAVFTMTEEDESGATTSVEDKLTRVITGVTKNSTTYTNWSGKSVNSDAVYAGQSAGGNDAIQLRATSPAGIITTTSGGTIKKVTVSWNSSTSGRTLDIYGKNSAYSKSDDLYGSDAGILLGSIASDSQTELTISGNYTHIGVRSNSGAMYINAITFTWAAGSAPSSTTYYTTTPTCEACTAVVTLTKGDAQNGSFTLDKVGEQSTCGGKLVVTVSDIAPANGYRFKAITQTGIENATIDQNAKTVTYSKKTSGASTINVLFEAVPQYTIAFFNNGTQIGDNQEVYEGQQPEVPANPAKLCEDYTFVGWWTAELAATNTESKTWISDFTATKDQDYYAIFKKTEESGSEPENNTYIFTTKAWKEATNSWTSDKDGNQVTSGQGVQVTKAIGTAGATTKSAVENITKVVVNYCTNKSDGAGSIKIMVGNEELSKSVSKSGGTTLRNLEYTFDNVSGKVALSVTCSTNSIYVYSVTITAGGKSSTTYYTSDADCTATGIEEVTSNEPQTQGRKVLINGQLYILYNNAMYTATGIRVQ